MKKVVAIVAAVFYLVGGWGVEAAVSDPELINPLRGYYKWNGLERIDREVVPAKDAYDRFTWREVESVLGAYDFSPIEAKMAVAASEGRKYWFAVRAMRGLCGFAGGASVPDYMLDYGWWAERDCDNNGQISAEERFFVPDWNHQFFLQRTEALLTALGQRYNQDERMSLVEIRMYGLFGEWHMFGVDYDTEPPVMGSAYCGQSECDANFRPVEPGNSQGGGSLKRIIDAYARAFPGKQLIMPVGGDNVTDAVMHAMALNGVSNPSVVNPVGWRSDCLGLIRNSANGLYYDHFDDIVGFSPWAANKYTDTNSMGIQARVRIDTQLTSAQVFIAGLGDVRGRNYYGVGFNGSDTFELRKKVNDGWDVLASYSLPVSERLQIGQWRTLRLEAKGGQLKGYLDGNLRVTAYNMEVGTGGYVWLRARWAKTAFDDVLVTEPGGFLKQWNFGTDSGGFVANGGSWNVVGGEYVVSEELNNNLHASSVELHPDSVYHLKNRWKQAPVVAEYCYTTPGLSETSGSGLPVFKVAQRQIQTFHVSMLGNGNMESFSRFSASEQADAILAGKLSGYRLRVGNRTWTSPVPGGVWRVDSEWVNDGVAPIYENWEVWYQWRNGGQVVWEGKANEDLGQVLSSASWLSSWVIPANVPVGNYQVTVVVRDPTGVRGNLKLDMPGRGGQGEYSLGTVALPAAPSVRGVVLGYGTAVGDVNGDGKTNSFDFGWVRN